MNGKRRRILLNCHSIKLLDVTRVLVVLEEQLQFFKKIGGGYVLNS